MVLCMSRQHTQIYNEGKLIGYWEPGVDPIIHHLGPKEVDLFIAGGEQIYRLWMPHIRRAFLTRIDYNGPSDTWMPSLWGNNPSIT